MQQTGEAMKVKISSQMKGTVQLRKGIGQVQETLFLKIHGLFRKDNGGPAGAGKAAESLAQAVQDVKQT